MNKGILCAACNEGFSPLDDALAQQLSDLNGLIGVRRDRDDAPRPARAQADEGKLLIDHHGRPGLDGPRVVRDEPLPDGRRSVGVEFPNEQAAQRWIAQQRALGRDVQTLQRSAGQRFPSQGAAISWSFGGSDAFREIGRIALNFLAHQWPDVARHRGLRSFKKFVKGPSPFRHALRRVIPSICGRRARSHPDWVWYSDADAFPLPTSPFAFGHQILLRVGDDGAYGRVRFFSAFDLFVWFGRLHGVQPEAIVVDIDPLADRPPDDVRFSPVATQQLPATIEVPKEHPDVGGLLRSRMMELLRRVEDLQWAHSTTGLLDAVNAARTLPANDRVDRIEHLLEPQRGRVLFLSRHVAGEARARAQTDVERVTADQLDALTEGDPSTDDGLTPLSRAALCRATRALAEAIASELSRGPLDDARLRLLLAGGPGAAIIGGALAAEVIASVARAST